MIYYLVQGDTGTQIKVEFSRKNSKEEVDITTASTLLKVRKEHSSEVLFSVLGALETDTINSAIFPLGVHMLTIEPGRYEAEVEVTFNNPGGPKVETVYDILNLYVREGF